MALPQIITDLIAKAKELLAQIDGQAAADAKGVIADLETSLADVHQQAVVLAGQVKTDVAGAVAATAPEVKDAVNAIVTKGETDITGVLGHVPGA
jgi:hypothetical protein